MTDDPLREFTRPIVDALAASVVKKLREDETIAVGPERPTPDEGLRFFASIRKADGLEVHRATEDRLALLAWLQVHRGPDDVILTLSMEASGPAIPSMIAALRFGARRLSR